MTEKDIQEILRATFGNHELILNNSYVFEWESDFLSKTKSGNIYEIEIKISRSDYFKDFDKDKHFLFKNAKQKIFVEKFPSPISDRSYYNQYVEDGKYVSAEYCKMKWYDPEKFNIPNKFYYAIPKGLISVDEVPAYAGLIEVNNYQCTIVKQAPFLHKRYLFNEKFMRMLLYKFWYLSESQRNKIFGYEQYISRQTDKNSII